LPDQAPGNEKAPEIRGLLAGFSIFLYCGGMLAALKCAKLDALSDARWPMFSLSGILESTARLLASGFLPPC
jgi:hypothetical protein